MSTTFSRAIRTLFVSLTYVALYIFMQNAVAFVFGLAGMYRSITVPTGYDPIWSFDDAISTNLYLCTIIAMFAAFVLYLMLGRLRDRPLRGELRFRRAGESVIIPAVLLALGCRLAVGVYTVLSQNVRALNESLENAPDYSGSMMTPTGLVLSLISTVIFAPIFEEILFRGFVQTELMRAFPPSAAIFVGALIFGAAHGLLFQSVFAFFVGLVLGWCYYVTDNLLTGMITHMVFNATSLRTLATVPGTPAFLTAAGVLAAALIISGGAWLYVGRVRRVN